MLNRAKEVVYNWYHGEDLGVKPDDVFIVWFCKTLQNWKALVGAHTPDHLYFEVTYDGDKGRTYLDVYAKEQNIAISDIVPSDVQEF